MTIHLIPDHLSVASSAFLVDYVSKFFSYSVKIKVLDKPIDHMECWSWDNLFAVGRAIKSQKKRVDGEDFFVVLTTGKNEYNWFCSFDINDPSVGFLQTTGWEKYGLIRPEYAVAYHLVSLITVMKFFGSDPNPYKIYHHKGLGCMFDFTGNKEEVIYKLKSAHICPDCVHSIAKHSNGNSQAFAFIKGVKDLLESVRNQLFQVDWSVFFKTYDYQLVVNEDLSLELKVEEEIIPLPISKGREAAVFMMLLKYENGLSYGDFQKPQFKKEYISFYHRYFVHNASLESLIKQADMEIEQKTYRKNLHATISKIKRKLTATLKQYPEIQKQVMIQTSGGNLVIPINRASLDPKVPELEVVG